MNASDCTRRTDRPSARAAQGRAESKGAAVKAPDCTRRAFLQQSVLLGGVLGAVACDQAAEHQPPAAPRYAPGEPLPWQNWSGGVWCVPQARLAPQSEAELGELLAAVARTPGPLRPVGAGHSFSALAPTDGTLLSLDALQGMHAFSEGRGEAEVYGGTRLSRLGPMLAARGRTLANFPDIAYPSLAGAVATSTHGTGAAFGSLSSLVTGMTLFTPRGERLYCSAEQRPELFAAARNSLGALGVISRLRIATVPDFRALERSDFVELDPLLEEAPRMARAHRHFEFFAFPHASVALRVVTDPEPAGPTAAEAEADAAEVQGAAADAEQGAAGAASASSAAEVVEQGEDDPLALHRLRDLMLWLVRLGRPGAALLDTLLRRVPSLTRAGPAHRVLIHTRLVRFHEMEYTVPAEAGIACLREILHAIRAQRIPVVFPIEFRYVRSDEIWLSPFYRRDGCSISIHQFHDFPYQGYFDAIEPIFHKYEGRPHWGKLHGLGAKQLAGLYPRWQDFQEVRAALDPEGRLLNDHLRHVLGV